MEQDKKNGKYYKYNADDSGINGPVIGKLMYSGLTSKGSLTDGKIYDCTGLSFGELRIIDDTGEAFYFHRKPSWKDKTAEFIVVEDNSPDKIMSAFVCGDETRTPQEKALEKEYIIGMTSMGFNRQGHVHKSKTNITGLVKRTKEIDDQRKSILSDFAKSIAPQVIAQVREFQKKSHLFDSPVGTEFDFAKGPNHYKVRRRENDWEILKISIVKREKILSPFGTLSNNFKTITEVKIHMTNVLKF